jgi:hypothetical protein
VVSNAEEHANALDIAASGVYKSWGLEVEGSVKLLKDEKVASDSLDSQSATVISHIVHRVSTIGADALDNLEYTADAAHLIRTVRRKRTSSARYAASLIGWLDGLTAWLLFENVLHAIGTR